MSLALVRRLLEAGGAKSLSVDHPLWELAAPRWPFSRRARRFASLQAEILDAGLAISGPLYLIVDENPQEFEVGGTWAHAHRRTWLIPDDCDTSALLARVLEPGAWSIYASYEPLDPDAIPDAFEVSPRQVANFSLAHSVPLLVQASHDSGPWRVWVENVTSQHEAAA